jgi:hypothetical protein
MPGKNGHRAAPQQALGAGADPGPLGVDDHVGGARRAQRELAHGEHARGLEDDGRRVRREGDVGRRVGAGARGGRGGGGDTVRPPR